MQAWSGFCLSCGHGETCAGVDAEEQSGMAVPHLQEPRRLLKRYVKHNSLFLWYVLTGR